MAIGAAADKRNDRIQPVRAGVLTQVKTADRALIVIRTPKQLAEVGAIPELGTKAKANNRAARITIIA